MIDSHVEAYRNLIIGDEVLPFLICPPEERELSSDQHAMQAFQKSQEASTTSKAVRPQLETASHNLGRRFDQYMNPLLREGLVTDCH